jgi:hypothetical protein
VTVTDNRSANLANEDNPDRENARAIRARQRAIGRELRRMYDDIAQEPVPQDFLELLKKIDESSPKKAS